MRCGPARGNCCETNYLWTEEYLVTDYQRSHPVVFVLRRFVVIALMAAVSAGAAQATSSPINAIRQDFKVNFCMPGYAVSWCKYVKRLDIKGTTLTARTTLRYPVQASQAASKICSALSGYVFTNTGSYGLKSVRVTTLSGRNLIWRPNLAAPCSM